MDYNKIYNNLIERAIERKTVKGYSEKHHILPKCLGGTDEKCNLVVLTAREHFIAHQLLIKIHKGNPKLIRAALMMCVFSETNHQRSCSNNRRYEWLRKKHSKYMSEIQKGENNNNYGKVWFYNLHEERSIKIDKTEAETLLSQGWLRGRVISFKRKKMCVVCGGLFIPQLSQKNARCCSKQCHKEHSITNSKWINIAKINRDLILEMNDKGKSITDICKTIGFPSPKGGYFNLVKDTILSGTTGGI